MNLGEVAPRSPIMRRHMPTAKTTMLLAAASQKPLASNAIRRRATAFKRRFSGREAGRTATADYRIDVNRFFPCIDARHRFQEPRHLVDAQHVGQLPRARRQHQAARQVRPIERHGEQEAQRRYRRADDGLADAVFALVKLKTPHVLGGRGIRRASQECREGAHVANIVVLGTRPHRAHRHVVEHPLTQRVNGSFGR